MSELFDNSEDFDVEAVTAETDKAWLVTIEGSEYWLPKSQCELDSKRKTVSIPKWLARQKELL